MAVYMARNGPVVLLRLQDNPLNTEWFGVVELADELDDLARLAARFPAKGEYPIPAIKMGCDKDRVTIQIIGADEAQMPHPYVRRITRGMRAMAGKAEAYAKAHRIIADQAALMRAGITLALSDDPDILKEARRIARNPGGITDG